MSEAPYVTTDIDVPKAAALDKDVDVDMEGPSVRTSNVATSAITLTA